MKILFISCNDWVPWGGSEELWHKTAIELQKSGHEVHINVKKWNPRPGHIQACLDAGCRVFEQGFKPSYTIIARVKRLFIADKFDQHQQNEEYLRSLNPEVVIINQGSVFDGMDWAKLCQQYKIPYCPIVQLVNEYIFYGDTEADTLCNLYVNAKKIFFVSSQNRVALENLLGQKLGQFEVVRNPFREFSGDLVYPTISNGYHLAFIASYNPLHKGHPMLFEIMADTKWKQRDLFINIYGKGIAENLYKKQLAYWGLDKVQMQGFESDLPNIWSHNHGLILASRMEGQSLALIEAMYCERVPIVTNVGGANEIIEHGISGFIARSPSIYHIEEALEEAWQKRDQWKTMGQEAQKSININLPQNPIKDFSEKILKVFK